MRRPLAALAVACACLAPAGAHAQQQPLKVVELFTSQSCSNSPQADDNIARIDGMEGVLALSMPVTYWNYFGWEDTLADPAFDARQQAYVDNLAGSFLYTPQVVINGRHGLGGDDLSMLRAHIAAAEPVALLPVSSNGKRLSVSVPEGTGKGDRALIFVSWHRAPQSVKITGGKNAGKTLTYHHVVEDLRTLSSLPGGEGGYASVGVDTMTGDACAFLLQDTKTQEIVGAGLCPGPRQS